MSYIQKLPELSGKLAKEERGILLIWDTVGGKLTPPFAPFFQGKTGTRGKLGPPGQPGLKVRPTGPETKWPFTCNPFTYHPQLALSWAEDSAHHPKRPLSTRPGLYPSWGHRQIPYPLLYPLLVWTFSGHCITSAYGLQF